MPKYREYFQKMLSENEELFDEFSQIHAKYQLDQTTNQAEFNRVGEKVVEMAREWEQRLCGHSEKGKNAVFSARLADKFKEEMKAFFPMIDFVGVEVTSGPDLDVTMEKLAEEEAEEEKDELDKAFDELEKIAVLDEDSFRIKRLL